MPAPEQYEPYDFANRRHIGPSLSGPHQGCAPVGSFKRLGVRPIEWYSGTHRSANMIASFRDSWLREFYVNDVRSRIIPPDIESRLFRKLQLLDDATTLQDLRVPPGNHFESLRGRLTGLHSLRVNDQWRLIFRWNNGRGEAGGVYLDDHSYR